MLCAQQPQQLEPWELASFLSNLLPSLQAMPQAAGRSVKLETEGPPLAIAGDRDKLRQVIVNLVANACEAIAPGEVVSLHAGKAGRQVVCRVHNGGAPIPPELLPQLTRPFVTTRAEGNGLGLAIVKRIVEAHGGELAIASSAAAGTTVTARWPESVS